MRGIVRALITLTGIGVSVAFSAGACEYVSPEQKEQIEEQNDAADGSGFGLPPQSDSPGASSVFDLREGDCIDEDLGYGELASTIVVPCADLRATHVVTDLIRVSISSGPYPSEPYFEDQFLLYCSSSATSFIWPTEESWAAGDRTVICLEEF
jgi:hypothetical protein